VFVSECCSYYYPTNERQTVTLKMLVTDVTDAEPARLPVLQVSEHSSLSNCRDTYIGGRAHMCRLCTQRRWMDVARRADGCAAAAVASGDRVLAIVIR